MATHSDLDAAVSTAVFSRYAIAPNANQSVM